MPVGALMVAVFGFVVLAAVACGNGRAPVPPSLADTPQTAVVRLITQRWQKVR